ncbi:hypothetical protein PIB30_097836, partial [Stylosanthes scabra]|nr:hypothetical protein [Stylosanthes scabra]
HQEHYHAHQEHQTLNTTKPLKPRPSPPPSPPPLDHHHLPHFIINHFLSLIPSKPEASTTTIPSSSSSSSSSNLHPQQHQAHLLFIYMT